MPYEIRQGDIPGIQLRCDRRYEIPGAELWKWLVDAGRMRLWLADGVEESPEGVRLVSTAEDGSPLVERGRTLARKDGRLWVLAFERLGDDWEMSTELRFEVTTGESESGDDCRLDILHRGFERLSLSRCLSVWELYRLRWRGALDRLALAVE